MKNILHYIFNFQTRSEWYHSSKVSWVAKVAWFTARRTRDASILASFILTGWVSAISYREIRPKLVYAQVTNTVTVVSTTTPPVMKRIAKCESGDKQFVNGQVLVKPNTNGTVDTGRYQINSIWNKQATALGLNLSVEKDNEAFAMYLYANHGTSDWSASAQCWNR